MKVLLINPPIRLGQPPHTFPTGLGIIAQVLVNEGHEVKVLDVNAERLSNSEVCNAISELDYDVVGIGGLITVYKYLKWIIPKLKEYSPHSKIIVGGGVATENPALLLSKTPADVAVIGEGEITMRELASALEHETSLKEIKGIFYKEGGEIIQNSPRPLIRNLDELPFPAWHLFPMDVYLHNVELASLIGKKTEMSLISTRGCPFDCSYCFHVFGRGARARSVDNVLQEIKELQKRYRVESILFNDETLTISRKRVMEFCNKLLQENIKIPWSCFARVNLIDKEMLETMKGAGCYWIGYGIESGSQMILDRMNKGVTVEQAKKAIHLTREVGLICGTTFMFGYPGENLETIRETINFCKELRLTQTFFYTQPYPGTALYEEVKEKIIERYGDEEKFIERLGDATEFVVNLTGLSDAELISLKESAEKELLKPSLILHRELEILRSGYKLSGFAGLTSVIKGQTHRLKKLLRERARQLGRLLALWVV